MSTNIAFKTKLREKFIHWYADEVAQLDESELSSHVDLRMSLVKPLHAGWLIETIQELEVQQHVIARGFEKAGILDVLLNCPADLVTTVSPPPSSDDQLV